MSSDSSVADRLDQDTNDMQTVRLYGSLRTMRYLSIKMMTHTGATHKLKNAERKTARKIASEAGHRDIELLLRALANSSSSDGRRRHRHKSSSSQSTVQEAATRAAQIELRVCACEG